MRTPPKPLWPKFFRLSLREVFSFLSNRKSRRGNGPAIDRQKLSRGIWMPLWALWVISIYHHCPESKRKISERNSGSIPPYCRHDSEKKLANSYFPWPMFLPVAQVFLNIVRAHRIRGRTLRGGVLGTFWQPPSENPFWETFSKPFFTVRPIAPPFSEPFWEPFLRTLPQNLLRTQEAVNPCL